MPAAWPGLLLVALLAAWAACAARAAPQEAVWVPALGTVARQTTVDAAVAVWGRALWQGATLDVKAVQESVNRTFLFPDLADAGENALRAVALGRTSNASAALAAREGQWWEARVDAARMTAQTLMLLEGELRTPADVWARAEPAVTAAERSGDASALPEQENSFFEYRRELRAHANGSWTPPELLLCANDVAQGPYLVAVPDSFQDAVRMQLMLTVDAGGGGFEVPGVRVLVVEQVRC